MPTAFDLEPDGSPFAARGTNDQLRGTILLRLKQYQADEPLDGAVVNLAVALDGSMVSPAVTLQDIDEVREAFRE
jgi:hypothetical protein